MSNGSPVPGERSLEKTTYALPLSDAADGSFSSKAAGGGGNVEHPDTQVGKRIDDRLAAAPNRLGGDSVSSMMRMAIWREGFADAESVKSAMNAPAASVLVFPVDGFHRKNGFVFCP